VVVIKVSGISRFFIDISTSLNVKIHKTGTVKTGNDPVPSLCPSV
jgi:hypothetical protein